MLEYIERDNHMYHNILIRIDEINRMLKEIEDSENNDEELSGNVTNNILENLMGFLNDRKSVLNAAINRNEYNAEWVNDYKDYIVGKVDMCDETISLLRRLMK